MANPVQSVKTLLDRYNATAELAVARGDHSRNFNAKEVGKEPAAATDAINGSDHFVGNDVVQKNFKIKQPPLITQFTGKGLDYANTLRVSRTPYAASGRL
jgi:hypothetical protein